MSAVRATGLLKRFGETTAVDGVDLTVAPGEVRGLLGPNGAGKTTLLRILFGLITPDAGVAEMLGRRINAGGRDALHGVGGFVEDPCFYPYLSGRGNLRLLARLDGDRDAEQVISDALARVDLAGRADARVAGYSTGMRQRLGIAAALVRSPRLLLLDEPTSGLDPAGAALVAELVRELAAEGIAILLSSHQIGELERVCTTFTFLREGRVVWDGNTTEMEAQAPVSAYALFSGNDGRALELAADQPGIRAHAGLHGGIAFTAGPGSLDSYVLALADARIPIRRLELVVSPLESMFFALTTDNGSAMALEPHELAQRVLASA